MQKSFNLLILFIFIVLPLAACSGSSDWRWSNQQNNWMPHAERDPYLEYEKHVQVPQWSHEDWVAEDWLSQYSDPEDLIRGFYRADILRDQITSNDRTILVVGPNFYHLSGFDKRRVAFMVDQVYNVTQSSPESAFFLKDWKTSDFIGVYDRNGLRLH